jgi:hypothetical protein
LLSVDGSSFRIVNQDQLHRAAQLR